jgi:hypothetical protein
MSESCPICDSLHANIDGVIMHLRNKQDSDHNHIDNQYQAVAVIQESENAVPELSTDTQNDDSDSMSGDSTSPDTDLDGGPDTEAAENPESVFDEPTGSAVSSTDIELPCGHESLDASELPDREVLVSCTVCGDEWAFQK